MKFRLLNPGEEVLLGDQFQRPRGEWINITQLNLDAHKNIKGCPFVIKEGDSPVRRPIKEEAIYERY